MSIVDVVLLLNNANHRIQRRNGRKVGKSFLGYDHQSLKKMQRTKLTKFVLMYVNEVKTRYTVTIYMYYNKNKNDQHKMVQT